MFQNQLNDLKQMFGLPNPLGLIPSSSYQAPSAGSGSPSSSYGAPVAGVVPTYEAPGTGGGTLPSYGAPGAGGGSLPSYGAPGTGGESLPSYGVPRAPVSTQNTVSATDIERLNYMDIL